MVDRDSNFRYIASNTFSLVFNGDQAVIKFGLAEDPSKPQQVFEQIAIVTSLPNAKILSASMKLLLDAIERDFGRIPFDESRLSEIKKSVTPQAASNSSPTS